MSAKERRQDRKNTSALLTTMALCAHSLFEGVAMGAALYLGNGHGHSHGHEGHDHGESTGGDGVGLLISAALFLHKAPEAAGFGTFLIQMTLLKFHLISFIGVYAIASPFSAFIAYSIFAGNNGLSIDNKMEQE